MEEEDKALQAAIDLSLQQVSQDIQPAQPTQQVTSDQSHVQQLQQQQHQFEQQQHAVQQQIQQQIQIQQQPTYDPLIYDFLKSAGFEEERIKRALVATNNKSIEAAINWITSDDGGLSTPSPTISTPPVVLPVFNTSSKRVKMVLVVRMDLKMGTGKIAAQCGHATLGLYRDIKRSNTKQEKEFIKNWQFCAEPKIALKVPDYQQMVELEKKAQLIQLPTHIVYDAGKTQIPAGSATVLSILGPVEMVDYVTGHLKLL